METYANALLIAIPGFFLLIIIEALYGHFKGQQTMNSMDTISSLSSGITNTLKDSLGLVFILISYSFMVEYFAIWEVEASWPVYVITFIIIDFKGYWTHRISHTVNIFWNKHAIHHSSEEFNLPCALRQTISNFVGIFTIFLLPAAIIGVPFDVIKIIAPLHLFLQFWYHTRHIPKLGWLEYLIITPSQHRVHHAINPIYIDKNLGQIFPWWDRMFGTFQEELEEDPPVYGITRPMSTWNPIKINFTHLWLLIQDARRTNNIWDKFRIWFMPTGWRPADVIDRYPVAYIEDVHNFEKYRSDDQPGLIAWSWLQLTVTTFLLLFMLGSYADLTVFDLFFSASLIFVGIYGYTSLMDQDRYAIWIELIRGVVGFGWVLYTGDWFGLNEWMPYGGYLVGAYFYASAVAGIWFHYQHQYQLKTKGLPEQAKQQA